MACAFTGPISGSASSSSLDAVLMLTLVPGASFSEEEEDFLEGEEGEDDAVALLAAPALPAAPPDAPPAPAAAPAPSSPFEELFDFFELLSDAAVPSFVPAAATPSVSL